MSNTVSSPLLKKKTDFKGVRMSFLLGCLTAAAIFLPFYIIDKGFYLHAGDFNLQQIPFYMYVQQFIKSGGGTWSWSTDLGSSIITSYSFYNIGSPFLWLTLLLPTRWMPFMMVPLLVLKFGCIAAAANLYMSRYAKTRNMVVIVSLVYAFCGFNVYNIFFNHMLDPVVFFPLLLWAMDGFFYEGKRGYFALIVAFALINSYFFFIGNVVFALIYFCVKVWQNDYKITGKKFASIALEAVLGVGMGMVLALPSLLVMLNNPRISNFAQGFNLVMYWNQQQYFAIISSMFLPPDPPYWPNLFTEGAIRFTSMSAFLPIVSVAGVIAFFKSRKKGFVRTMLVISLVMALVPILNASFYAFNASYYARWYYMPILMMCLATVHSLEGDVRDLEYGAKWALGLTALYSVFGILPKVEDGVRKFGVAQQASRFWLTIIVAVLGIGTFFLLVSYYKNPPKQLKKNAGKKQKGFASLLLASVMAFSVIYSIVHISMAKMPQFESDSTFKQTMYDSGGELTLPDDGFYRIDGFGITDNFSLWTNQNALRTFNSVVTPSITEFYPYVGVKRDVASRPEHSLYALRGLLNVRFMVVEQESEYDFYLSVAENMGETLSGEDVNNMGYAERFQHYKKIAENGGWKYHSTQKTLVVFENTNFVPLGFTYDQYVAQGDMEFVFDTSRGNILMQALMLTSEQEKEYAHLFDSKLAPAGVSISYNNYVSKARERAQTASYKTSYDSSGFSCNILLDKENLVFFSVPYDEGFTATVNGKQTPVLKVSNGMMAVVAPKGDNAIIFKYKTPGFGLGILISVVSLVLLLVYMVVMGRLDKKRRYKKLELVTAGNVGKKRAVPLAAKELGTGSLMTEEFSRLETLVKENSEEKISNPEESPPDEIKPE